MTMITELEVEQYTIRGASLGGLYTSLYIPQLDSLFDVGLAIRTGASATRLFLSHAHLDHLGSLPSLLGMRGMMGGKLPPLDIYCPYGIKDDLQIILQHLSKLHHWALHVNIIELEANQEVQLKQNLWVKALTTFHPVPSLGYLLFDRVAKLKKEYHGLEGKKIKALKDRGIDIQYFINRPKVAYLTDTLPETLKHNPSALDAELLIIECTFFTDKKGIEVARAGCHIHVEELIPWAPKMNNKAIVLMHFSQIHPPSEIRAICEQHLRPILGERLHLFLPPQEGDIWWN